MWTRSLYICCKKKKKHSSFLFISFISVDIILARISFPRVLYISFYIYTLHVVHWRLKNNSIKENDSYSIFLSPRWTFFRFICKCINDKMSVQCGIMTNEMNVDAEMSIHYPYSSKYHSTVWSMKQKTCFFCSFVDGIDCLRSDDSQPLFPYFWLYRISTRRVKRQKLMQAHSFYIFVVLYFIFKIH